MNTNDFLVGQRISILAAVFTVVGLPSALTPSAAAPMATGVTVFTQLSDPQGITVDGEGNV
jgi:hypothetical protein